MIRRLFSSPIFEQEEKNFRAKFINGFAWSVIGLLLLALIPQLANPKNFTIAVFSGLIVVMAIALYLLRRGNVDASGTIIVVLGWLGVSIQAFTADGVKDVIVVAFLALGLLASITVNWRAAGIVILGSMGMIWALALLEVNGIFTPSSQNPIAYARDLSFVFIAVTVLVGLSTTSLQNAIRRATISEKELVQSNQDLQELNQTLEDRVSIRTVELEMANQRNERRARQFEAIAQVARATTSIQDEDMLLFRLAQVISEQFGFYHVGIFLLDPQRENAILRASNSGGGRRMLARKHSLKVGQAGMVGHVASSGNPRIALNVEEDAAFKDNPDLPGTRSELALPLKDADQLIGVLDVQSTESNAFLPEDTEILYTLADQVTIAIQNARSHESTRRLLEEAQRTSESYIKEAWRLIQSEEKTVGYIVAENTLKPLEKLIDYPFINRVLSQEEPWVENRETGTLAVPIHLRGEVVGVLDIRVPKGHDWDPDEVDIAKAVADRLSLALESATLLKTTQRRAEIERLTADISGKIGASVNMRNVLQTAVEELGRVLPGSEVVIQFQSEKGNGSK
jgi:Transcriptional regulator containing GAF, AAA-type ATPase, and DNA binding domains